MALFIISCSPATGYKLVGTSVIDSTLIKPIIDKSHSLLYKARIKLFNHQFSGLMVMKQTDHQTSHLTFVTEIGMKIFDFEIRDTSFKLDYIFEPINKPSVIRLLKHDMKLILLEQLHNKSAKIYEKKGALIYKTNEGYRYYYRVNRTNHTVEEIIKKGSIFTKEKVMYNYNYNLNPTQIRLKHKGMIRLKMEFNQLTKTDETPLDHEN